MKKGVKIENQTEERSLKLFLNKCDGSQKTQQAYLYQVDRFMKWAKISTYDGLLEAPNADLERLLEDYIMYLKDRVSPNTIPIIWSAIKKFYRANRKKLDFESIEDLFPKKVRKSGKEAYSDEDMKMMLRHALKKRTRALFYFIASTNCREGAIPVLQMQHIENIGDGCKAVLIYGDANSGEDEEYWAFLTPEASKALEEYWEERRNDGEFFKKESPVFRSDYEIAIAPAKPMTEQSIIDIFETLVQHVTSRKKITATRYNIQIVHGVRKWSQKKIKKNSSISFSTSEKLAGRKAYLDGEYYPITKEEAFEQFKKIISDLTLDDTERKNIEINNQKKEIEKLEEEKKKIIEQDKKIENLVQKVEEMKIYEEYLRRSIAFEEDLPKDSKTVSKYLEECKKELAKQYHTEVTTSSKKLSEHNTNEGDTSE